MLDLRALARWWGNVGLLAGLSAIAAYAFWEIGGPWGVGWWLFLLAWLFLLGVACVATALALAIELADAWRGRSARKPFRTARQGSVTPSVGQ